jgi:M6 family metalloprotease-like protein
MANQISEMQATLWRYLYIAISVAFTVMAVPPRGFSLEPPRAGEIEQYKKDGSFSDRRWFAEYLQNNKFHPDVVKRKIARMKSSQQGSQITTKTLFPYKTGLPAEGSPKIVVLLVDFPNYPHTTDSSVFAEKLFGNGNPSAMPFDSLRNYYQRSSYGKLNIQGTVLGWYRARHWRGFYSLGYQTRHSINGVKKLIKEAFNHYAAEHDFSQYDNNGDGKIDYFCIIWTGPDKGWSSIWWGWCNNNGSLFANDPFTVSGKGLSVFSWQWEKNESQNQPEYTPQTIIHETGHALGLPDYYDYDEKKGPSGGVGGLDIMDGNDYDHNCFSKWMLEWLTPSCEITSGAYTVSLRPAAITKDGVAIMPGAGTIDPFSEFFMVQNRTAGIENDFRLPNSGFLIWHVDARLNQDGTNFQFDNSYTEHKLLRLMEADGREHLETLGRVQEAYFDPLDFYVQGTELTPNSMPNSRDYSGNDTGIIVRNIAADPVTQIVMADCAIGEYSSTQTTIPDNPTTSIPGNISTTTIIPGQTTSTIIPGDTTTTIPGGVTTTAIQGGGIGAACSSGSCDPGLECITSAPDGYCTKSCVMSADCGPGAYCYTVQSEQGQQQSLCLAACSTDADCRSGYTCQGTTNFTVCLPGGSSGTTTISGGSGGPIIDSFTVEPKSGYSYATKGFDYTVFTFTCRAHDTDGGSIVEYRWDLDGNGNWDYPYSYPDHNETCYFVYDFPGKYTAQVWAVDNNGNVSDPAVINNIVVQ